MKPKHQILYEKILKKIQERAWPDDKLPSEKELMAIYDVPRDSVMNIWILPRVDNYEQKLYIY